MLTVRFASGLSVQYNSACWWTRDDSGQKLWEDKSLSRIVAVVPTECIIEFVPACRVYNPLTEAAQEGDRKALAATVRRAVRDGLRRGRKT